MGEQVFSGPFLRKGVDGGRASRVLRRPMRRPKAG